MSNKQTWNDLMATANSVKSEVAVKDFFDNVEFLAKDLFQYIEDITRMADFGIHDTCFSSEKALKKFQRLSKISKPVLDFTKKPEDAYILSIGFNDENGKFHPRQIWGFWNP